MTVFSSVEAKDELVEVSLQMFAAQPVVDAARLALEVGEDLVVPGKDEMSGGLAEDMDVVEIRRNAAVAGPAVGLGDGVEIGGGFAKSRTILPVQRFTNCACQNLHGLMERLLPASRHGRER